METKIFNIVSIKKTLELSILNDKKNFNKNYYFWHREVEDIMVIDNKSQYEEQVDLYKSQGFIHYKTIDATNRIGSVKAKIHVFRKEGINLSFDPVSVAFGYLNADCEQVIVEVVHRTTNITPKKNKRK